jgi:hypothetical protein
MTDHETNLRELLSISLSAAVPLRIHELTQKPWSEVEALARESAQVVAEKGDVLQFKGKGTAEAFNALATGLAALAFAPGGVTFLGLRFEAIHPDTRRSG